MSDRIQVSEDLKVPSPMDIRTYSKEPHSTTSKEGAIQSTDTNNPPVQKSTEKELNIQSDAAKNPSGLQTFLANKIPLHTNAAVLSNEVLKLSANEREVIFDSKAHILQTDQMPLIYDNTKTPHDVQSNTRLILPDNIIMTEVLKPKDEVEHSRNDNDTTLNDIQTSDVCETLNGKKSLQTKEKPLISNVKSETETPASKTNEIPTTNGKKNTGEAMQPNDSSLNKDVGKTPDNADDKRETSANKDSLPASDTKNTNKNPFPPDENADENETISNKMALKSGLYCMCTVQILLLMLAQLIFCRIYFSNMPGKINMIIRLFIVMGIVLRGIYVICLFIGAVKDNTNALFYAYVMTYMVFIIHEAIGVLGFVCFVRIAMQFTWNFLITIYFAFLVLIEFIIFLRDRVIIVAYRDLLMSRPVDEKILLVALCCSTCDIRTFLHNASRQPMAA